jgi:flavin reductase (DIM6/NTAB) family NADH-FMN oxidoreductase RutF
MLLEQVMQERSIDPRDLRRALGAFATGVTIVTTADEAGSPWGFTANSFTSVSLDPPLLLVCLAKSAGSYQAFKDCEHFAVNILSEAQREASSAFASLGKEKFTAVTWGAKATGSPVIEGVVAWLDCQRHETVDAGDHIIMIGRIVDYDHGSDAPLGYCRGAYVSFGLAQEAQKASEQEGRVRIGAIIERDGAVLIDEDPKTGEIQLPTAAKIGDAGDPKSLLGRLAAEGVSARLPFLFAVYDQNDTHFIFYRGEASRSEGGGENRLASLRFVDFAEIPWERITDGAVRTMLERYVAEQDSDQFGIYVGGFKAGDVHSLS